MIRALRFLAFALVAIALPAAAAAPVTGHHSAQVQIISVTKSVEAPASPVDEAKFPNEDAKFVDALQYVNKLVNDTIQPESDEQHYGVEDYWVQYPADNKGDCEDYALTKLGILGHSGFPIIMNAQLRTVIVNGPISGNQPSGHAVLEVLMPNGSISYLDNLHEHLMKRRELVAEGYEFPHWADTDA